jgi:DtxR family Mn-dependent transcriptional regulator
MEEKITQTVEDYLKVIYEITTTEQRASTNQIAETLGITPASVTGMIKKLAETEPPLVDYQRHHGVTLTEKGVDKALEVIRHHRLLEMFLHQILGYDWDEVHTEADRLEHFISEEFEERIAQVLGNPMYDPHGHPIPTRDLKLPESKAQQLSLLRPGQKAMISKVNDSNSDLLRYLSDLGLIPKANIIILDYSPFDKNIQLQVVDGERKPIVLGPDITRQIFVEIL